MNKNIFLLLIITSFIYLCYAVPSIIAIFFISLSFAYLLQPLAKKLSNKCHIDYVYGAVIIYSLFLVILISALSILIPQIISQIETLISKAPQFKEIIEKKIIPKVVEKALEYGGENIKENFKASITSYMDNIGNIAGYTANLLWSYALSTINIVSMCILFPILLFFFLKDWPVISRSFKNFISNIGLGTVNEIWKDLDDLLVGFIKALLNVGTILAILYWIGLKIIGFEFALIVAIVSGFAVVIPLIGPIIAISLSLSLSLLVHGLDTQQLWILSLYAILQILDNSYLSPKIIGDRIGLHPTVIIFSVFVSSEILGLAGLFLAIPIAGLIKILFRKFILS